MSHSATAENAKESYSPKDIGTPGGANIVSNNGVFSCPTPEEFKAQAEEAFARRLKLVQPRISLIYSHLSDVGRASGLKFRRKYLNDIQNLAIELLNITTEGLNDLLTIEQAEHAQERQALRQKLAAALEVAKLPV